jgi:hypothetical protein
LRALFVADDGRIVVRERTDCGRSRWPFISFVPEYLSEDKISTTTTIGERKRTTATPQRRPKKNQQEKKPKKKKKKEKYNK